MQLQLLHHAHNNHHTPRLPINTCAAPQAFPPPPATHTPHKLHAAPSTYSKVLTQVKFLSPLIHTPHTSQARTSRFAYWASAC